MTLFTPNYKVDLVLFSLNWKTSRIHARHLHGKCFEHCKQSLSFFSILLWSNLNYIKIFVQNRSISVNFFKDNVNHSKYLICHLMWKHYIVSKFQNWQKNIFTFFKRIILIGCVNENENVTCNSNHKVYVSLKNFILCILIKIFWIFLCFMYCFLIAS